MAGERKKNYQFPRTDPGVFVWNSWYHEENPELMICD